MFINFIFIRCLQHPKVKKHILHCINLEKFRISFSFLPVSEKGGTLLEFFRLWLLRLYRFYRFYRIMRELKKFKMLYPLGSEPRHLWHPWFSYPACHTSVNSPFCWKSQLFRSLCTDTLLIIGLRYFFWIYRAWLHKNPKGLDFQQIRGSMHDLKVKGVRCACVHFPVRVTFWYF